VKPRYRFVFFDVDSTLVTIEGIDVLAGGNPEIARLTAAAMNGEVALDDVYGRRLEVIRPTLPDVEALGARYCASLVDGVALQFDGERYAGFDRHSFLTRTGGKELVVRDLRARSHGKAALVGDGISDLEAAPAVDLFIGFGGVAMRPVVRERAAAYETTFAALRDRLIDPL